MTEVHSAIIKILKNATTIKAQSKSRKNAKHQTHTPNSNFNAARLHSEPSWSRDYVAAAAVPTALMLVLIFQCVRSSSSILRVLWLLSQQVLGIVLYQWVHCLFLKSVYWNQNHGYLRGMILFGDRSLQILLLKIRSCCNWVWCWSKMYGVLMKRGNTGAITTRGTLRVNIYESRDRQDTAGTLGSSSLPATRQQPCWHYTDFFLGPQEKRTLLTSWLGCLCPRTWDDECL